LPAFPAGLLAQVRHDIGSFKLFCPGC